MIWRRSLSRPGLSGFPACSQCSRDWPPFQARVVKPRISTLTPQRSSVRARMSAQVAATVMGRPRIEPELSISSVTTVSRKFESFSRLNDSGDCGSTTTRDSRAGSSMPSSRSNSQARFCWAIRRRCSRFASRATTRGEILQLLVEISAQAFQLLGVAEILGADDFVELRREGAIFIAAKGRGIARPDGARPRPPRPRPDRVRRPRRRAGLPRRPLRRREFRPSPPRRVRSSAPRADLVLLGRLRFRPPGRLAAGRRRRLRPRSCSSASACSAMSRSREDLARRVWRRPSGPRARRPGATDRRRRASRPSRARDRRDWRPPGAAARRSGLARQQGQRVLDRRIRALADFGIGRAFVAVVEHRREICDTPAMRRAPIASTRACSIASKMARPSCACGASAGGSASSWQARRKAIASA